MNIFKKKETHEKMFDSLKSYFNLHPSTENVKEVDEEAGKEAEKTFRSALRLHIEFSIQTLEFTKEIGDEWLIKERYESEKRKKFACIITILIFLFLVVQILVFVLHGFRCIPFYLNKYAIFTFFGTFTSSFIGLILIILRYYFNERSIESLKIIKDFIVEMNRINCNFIMKEEKKHPNIKSFCLQKNNRDTK